MNIKRSVGLSVVCSFFIAVLVLAGCGTVKKATDGGSSGGGSSQSPSAPAVPVVECAWTTLNATGLSWGTKLFLDVVNGKPTLTYDYNQQPWESPTNRVLQTLTGTTWSAPVSGDVSNIPGSSPVCISGGSTYTLIADTSVSYYPKLIVKKDSVEVFSLQGAFGDSYDYFDLQVVGSNIYIAYSNYNYMDNSRNGVYIKTATPNAQPLDIYINHGEALNIWGLSLKVVNENEAYLAYSSYYLGQDTVVMKWSAK